MGAQAWEFNQQAAAEKQYFIELVDQLRSTAIDGRKTDVESMRTAMENQNQSANNMAEKLSELKGELADGTAFKELAQIRQDLGQSAVAGGNVFQTLDHIGQNLGQSAVTGGTVFQALDNIGQNLGDSTSSGTVLEILDMIHDNVGQSSNFGGTVFGTLTEILQNFEEGRDPSGLFELLKRLKSNTREIKRETQGVSVDTAAIRAEIEATTSAIDASALDAINNLYSAVATGDNGLSAISEMVKQLKPNVQYGTKETQTLQSDLSHFTDEEKLRILQPLPDYEEQMNREVPEQNEPPRRRSKRQSSQVGKDRDPKRTRVTSPVAISGDETEVEEHSGVATSSRRRPGNSAEQTVTELQLELRTTRGILYEAQQFVLDLKEALKRQDDHIQALDERFKRLVERVAPRDQVGSSASS